MCGIIGYTGSKPATKILIDGLSALSYRGYDSAGIALQDNKRIITVKTKGRVSDLQAKLTPAATVANSALSDSTTGIGHTRWATHGEPSDHNAHPHGTEQLALVHNGIIENHAALRSELKAAGYHFASETDSEAAALLIDQFYTQTHDPIQSILSTCKKITGSFAFAIVFADQPGQIYAIRRGSPLIIARGPAGNYLASDTTALAGAATEFSRLAEDTLVLLDAEDIRLLGTTSAASHADASADATPTTPALTFQPLELTDADVTLGDYPHFMLKEISESPAAFSRTLEMYLSGLQPTFPTDLLNPANLKHLSRIRIVACGTASHAGLIGKSIIEKLARIPVEVSLASEFRYSHPIIDDHELMIVISQSGETADTLAALRYAKAVHLPVLAIVNTPGSTIAEEADACVYTAAGPEIAVASTKAYTVQCAVLYLIAAQLASARGRLSPATAAQFITALKTAVPSTIKQALSLAPAAQSIAGQIKDADHLFFIGRTDDFYLCAEASLKLKEISYIHSEAFAAGELKHGTISLIENGTPVIAFLTNPDIADKTASNIREAAARGAKVYAITTAAIARSTGLKTAGTILLPEVSLDTSAAQPTFSSADFAVFPAAIILQLLAYYAALARGNDVDKPRNLAKSVTVE